MPPGQQEEVGESWKQSPILPHHGMLLEKPVVPWKPQGGRFPAYMGEEFQPKPQWFPWGLPQDRVNDFAPSTRLRPHFSVGLERFFFLLTVHNPDMPCKHCLIPEPSLKRALLPEFVQEDRTNVSEVQNPSPQDYGYSAGQGGENGGSDFSQQD